MSKDKTNADKWDNDPKAMNKPTSMVVNKYLAELRRVIEDKEGKQTALRSQEDSGWELEQYAYRGQADSGWALESTAYRRYEGNLLPEDFIKYNCNLVNKAKNAHYHLQENKNLKDIEMLAELRHYNAATALIDFTRNFLVALWFACESANGDKKPGRVFIVNIGEIGKFIQLTSEDEEESLEKILRFQTRGSDEQAEGSRLWYWEPRFEINHRLSSQKGVFILGKPLFSDEDIDYEEVEIRAEDKDAIRLELDVFFNISEATLFNDLHGFAGINDANHKISLKIWTDYLKRGNEHFQQGELEKAIEQYDKAIELNDEYFSAYCNRGLANVMLGKYNEALSDLNQAIDLNDKDAAIYHFRGNTKLQLGRHKEAIDDINRAINLDPKNANAYVSKGRGNMLLKNYSEALVDLNQALELDPQNSFPYAARGDVKLQLGRHDEALEDFNQAIELNPKDSFSYAARGNVKLQLKQHNEALEDLNQAIELNPQDAVAYYSRGLVHKVLNNIPKAQADFKKALKLAAEQDGKEVIQSAQQALDDLPPSLVS